MNLVPYDARKIRTRKYGCNQAIFEEFLNSELECVKIENYSHKNVNSCYSSLRSSLIGADLTGSIRVVMLKREVYLIKRTGE